MRNKRDYFSQVQAYGFNTLPPMPNNFNTDPKLAQIEEQIKDLNERLTKLESILTNEAKQNFNSMYML